MNVWALVACKSDKSDLASFLRLRDGFDGSAVGENAIRIGIANHFVELEQVDPIRLQPAQRFVDLGCGSGLVAAIDLGHQEGFLAIAIAQCFAHANFTLSAVVVPAVVEEIDSFIDSGTHDANTLVGIALFAQVISTEPDQRNAFARAAERSMWNSAFALRLCGTSEPSGQY